MIQDLPLLTTVPVLLLLCDGREYRFWTAEIGRAIEYKVASLTLKYLGFIYIPHENDSCVRSVVTQSACAITSHNNHQRELKLPLLVLTLPAA